MSFLLYTCVFPFFVSCMMLTVLVVWLRRRRRLRMAQIAAKFGLEKAGAEDQLRKILAENPILPTDDFKVQIAYHGTFREQAILFADLAYSLGKGGERTRHYASLVILPHNKPVDDSPKLRWFELQATAKPRAPTPLSLARYEKQDLKTEFIDAEFELYADQPLVDFVDEDLARILNGKPPVAFFAWEKDLAIFHRQRRLTPKMMQEWIELSLELRDKIQNRISPDRSAK